MAEVDQEHGEGLADTLDKIGITYAMDDGILSVDFSFFAYDQFLLYKESFRDDPDVIVSMMVVETITKKPVSQELPRIMKKPTEWYLVGDKSKRLPYNIEYHKSAKITKKQFFEEAQHKKFENLKIYWIETKIGSTQHVPPTGSAGSALSESGKESRGGKRRKGTRRRKNKSKRFSIKKGV